MRPAARARARAAHGCVSPRLSATSSRRAWSRIPRKSWPSECNSPCSVRGWMPAPRRRSRASTGRSGAGGAPGPRLFARDSLQRCRGVPARNRRQPAGIRSWPWRSLAVDTIVGAALSAVHALSTRAVPRNYAANAVTHIQERSRRLRARCGELVQGPARLQSYREPDGSGRNPRPRARSRPMAATSR